MDREQNKKIIIFAGTNEGRKLCEFLTGHGESVTACVATEYGSLCLSDIPNLKLLEGRLSDVEMEVILADRDYIVDATHPFAKLVSENLQKACERLNKTCLRIVRPQSDYQNVIECKGIDEACDYLNTVSGKVLITTGSKELLPYTKVKDYESRFYVRVLPSLQSIEECLAQGFKSSNIIGMQGPFTEEMNVAMLRQLKAEYLVTKETGKSGGFEEKLSAAKICKVKTIVIGRPVKEEGVSLEEAYEYFQKELELTERKESYFPMFLNLKAKKIVMVGAGSIAARRLKTLSAFTTNITVIAPEIHSEIQNLGNNIKIYEKEYEEQDIKDAFIVVAATNNRQINRKIYEDSRKLGILVNVVDKKEESDFYFPAVFSDENILGGIISKNGEKHKLVKEKAHEIRKFLSKVE